MTTNDYLDAIKARYSLTSDYQLAKFWGVSRQRISKWRNEKDYLGDEAAIRAAELLEIDPAEVLANVYAERTKAPQVRRVWEDLARRLATAATVCFVLIFSPFSVDSAQASPADRNAPQYILCKIAMVYRFLAFLLGFDLFLPKHSKI